MSGSYIPDHGDDSYDVTHYRLGLGYKLIGNRLVGDAVLTCLARTDTTSVTLDLAGLRVSKVLLDGKTTRVHAPRLAAARSLPELAADQEFELRVKYDGSPGTLKARDLDDAGWEELADGVIVAAQPHGAPTWFPCNDRPSNKATYAITMAAPNEYYVAMCGRPHRQAAPRLGHRVDVGDAAPDGVLPRHRPDRPLRGAPAVERRHRGRPARSVAARSTTPRSASSRR